MNKNLKISVIIPVYNSEKHIKRCIDSILSQKFKGFELILVDDGSSDSSGGICDNYAIKYPNIKVIHTENSGVSSARNIGLSMAEGKYVAFADSDDFLSDNTLRTIYSVAEENTLDVLQYNYYVRDEKGELIPECCTDDISTDVVNPQKYFDSGMCLGYVWATLIRRDIIVDSKICFVQDLSLSEDRVFVMEVLCHSKRVMRISDKLYHYISNPKSLVNTCSTGDFLQLVRVMYDFIQKYPMTKGCSMSYILNNITKVARDSSISDDVIFELVKIDDGRKYSGLTRSTKLFRWLLQVNFKLALWVIRRI